MDEWNWMGLSERLLLETGPVCRAELIEKGKRLLFLELRVLRLWGGEAGFIVVPHTDTVSPCQRPGH